VNPGYKIMKGKVILYSPDGKAGMIRCEKGNKYLFTRREWLSLGEPKVDKAVTFEGHVDKAVNVKAV
jgi:hypothetical protein